MVGRGVDQGDAGVEHGVEEQCSACSAVTSRPPMPGTAPAQAPWRRRPAWSPGSRRCGRRHRGGDIVHGKGPWGYRGMNAAILDLRGGFCERSQALGGHIVVTSSSQAWRRLILPARPMRLRRSSFVHKIPVGPDRVLLVHAISHLRFLANDEIARVFDFFETPRTLPDEALPLLAELGCDRDALARLHWRPDGARGALTEKDPEAEAAEFGALMGYQLRPRSARAAGALSPPDPGRRARLLGHRRGEHARGFRRAEAARRCGAVRRLRHPHGGRLPAPRGGQPGDRPARRRHLPGRRRLRRRAQARRHPDRRPALAPCDHAALRRATSPTTPSSPKRPIC